MGDISLFNYYVTSRPFQPKFYNLEVIKIVFIKSINPSLHTYRQQNIKTLIQIWLEIGCSKLAEYGMCPIYYDELFKLAEYGMCPIYDELTLNV